jgi:hypothetical protein
LKRQRRERVKERKEKQKKNKNITEKSKNNSDFLMTVITMFSACPPSHI